jgi:phage FluMu protein Com
MPIEFRCTQCGKLLRTGDDTAGRQAQCPACGALSTVPGPVVPEAVETGASQVPPLAPLGSQVPSSPTPVPGPLFGAGPYAAYPSTPTHVPGLPPAQRVAGPANALIVTAVLGIFVHVLSVAADLVPIGLDLQGPAKDIFGPHTMISHTAHVFFGILGLALAVFVLLGASKMKNLQNYGFAMAAAIIALVPCTSPCCLLGLPFGIWALVVLTDSSVKAAFRS